MIKENCERCGKPYLGEACSCWEGRKAPALDCDCGGKAVAVWVDEFGEWGLCRECLELAKDEFASMPLPRWDQNQNSRSGDTLDEDEFYKHLPFDLTKREYEIAMLAHYNNRQISETLQISPHTVQAHLKRVFQKLGIRSRFEIPFILPHNENELGITRKNDYEIGDCQGKIAGDVSGGSDRLDIKLSTVEVQLSAYQLVTILEEWLVISQGAEI